MGLDMYLNAERHFDPASDEVRSICSLADTTTEKLRSLAEDGEWEDYLYLGFWEFSEDSDKSIAVLKEAGLWEMRDLEGGSCSGSLRWKDGKVIAGITCLYWRKTNSVHAWFVDECQDGVDDCRTTPVHVEQLALLKAKCDQAVEAFDNGDLDRAESIMSPRSGFFFGSTELNEWWRNDLAYTSEGIERVVRQAIELGGIEFSYHSSW